MMTSTYRHDKLAQRLCDKLIETGVLVNGAPVKIKKAVVADDPYPGTNYRYDIKMQTEKNEVIYGELDKTTNNQKKAKKIAALNKKKLTSIVLICEMSSTIAPKTTCCMC